MRCVIIAGSPDTDINFIRQTVTDGDFVICADRGYSHAKAAGIAPNLIIGDFDSCKDEIHANCEVISLNVEKDFTDTLHCIDNALKKGYYNIVILGALGGRLDHSLGNLYALDYIAEHKAKGIILSGRERVELLGGGAHKFSGFNSLTFSLFPIGCAEACVSIEGAKYPLEKYSLQSSVPIGVSNIFESDSAAISVYSGKAILIINTDNQLI